MTSRPNILFITADQQHPDSLGLVDPRISTPNLDRLGREGALLTRSYTSSPVCTPARATWITGQYPSKHGAWMVGTVLDPECLSVARLLGGSGYRTAMIGKSHLQPCHVRDHRSCESHPRANDTAHHRLWFGPWYGFDHVEINCGHTDEAHSASMHYRAWLEDRGVDIARHFACTEWDKPLAWELPERFHPNAWISERAAAYLREHAARRRGEPFYLNLNFPDPHGPMHVPEPWFGKYDGAPLRSPTRRWGEWEGKPTIYRAHIEKRVPQLGWHERFGFGGISTARTALDAGERATGDFIDGEIPFWRAYWGMTSLLDHHVGRVLDAVDELGLAQDTLVVYTCDHGELMGDHFLEGKGPCHYDGSVRVPTLARFPGRIPAGRRCEALVNNVDLAPTFLAAAGLEPHPLMQGVDQLEVWQGRAAAARQGAWIDYRAERGLYVNSWITERWRLSVHATADRGDELELYDLREDTGEFVNLADDPAYAGTMARLMAEMLREITDSACPWQERISGS
jgi:uncharacterized sulfatase